MTKNSEQVLIILQGPSGSGKSTLAKSLLWDIYNRTLQLPEICSTDDFFYEGEEYCFNPKMLGANHKKNQARAKTFMDEGRTVIIDNTNVHAWEARPYVEHANKLNIPVIFIRCEGKFANIHGVPTDKVAKMEAELEELTVEKVLNAKAPWE